MHIIYPPSCMMTHAWCGPLLSDRGQGCEYTRLVQHEGGYMICDMLHQAGTPHPYIPIRCMHPGTPHPPSKSWTRLGHVPQAQLPAIAPAVWEQAAPCVGHYGDGDAMGMRWGCNGDAMGMRWRWALSGALSGHVSMHYTHIWSCEHVLYPYMVI